MAYLFLAWLIAGARLFANLPYAVLIPPFPMWLLLGYYAIVLGGWLWNVCLILGSDVAPNDEQAIHELLHQDAV